MSNTCLHLINRRGFVFETTDFGQSWTHGKPDQGVVVEDSGMSVNMAVAEFACVLPPLSAGEPGRFPIFTVASGVPCPSSETGGALLHVAYEPSKALIHFGMNAGGMNAGGMNAGGMNAGCKGTLQYVSLGPAPPEHYTRRVLRITVLMAPNGLYPSVEDPCSDQDEFFGELSLARPLRLPPWGELSRAGWWIRSGCIWDHTAERSMPAGFGLADVRVCLIDISDDGFHTMPYSEELDHLVAESCETDLWEDLETSDDGDEWDVSPHREAWDLSFDDEPVSRMLDHLAGQLEVLSGDARKWAMRAEDLAEEARETRLHAE